MSKFIFEKGHTAVPYRASTNSHREKPVFITANPCSHCRDPVFITGNSLWELVHREIPVVITGNGFAVQTSNWPSTSTPHLINLLKKSKDPYLPTLTLVPLLPPMLRSRPRPKKSLKRINPQEIVSSTSPYLFLQSLRSQFENTVLGHSITTGTSRSRKFISRNSLLREYRVGGM